MISSAPETGRRSRPGKKRRIPAWGIWACLSAFLWGWPFGSPAAATNTIPDSGTVVHISDGDTVTVRFGDGTERRVRLIGVDCPEMDDPREEAAFHAFLSWRFAFHHLYRRDIRLTYDFAPLDEHGRVLAYIWLGQAKLFNDFIIRQGFAAAFLKYPFQKEFQERFRDAGAEARANRRGFWREDAPPVIAESDVPDRLGEIISVRFPCAMVSEKKAFLYLRSQGGFEAPLPRSRLPLFPDIRNCAGKEVVVTGFLEDSAGRPQVMLYFARQLRLT
jgi:endonuclease YncB( thermonuclease family)